MKNKKKLYYCEDQGEFYNITETPKTFLIEWVASGKTPLNHNVKWGDILRVPKENKGRHCLKSYDKKHILIYPFQAGTPFYLEPATKEHVASEIADCLRWGVSTDYYKNLINKLEN